MRRFDGEDHVLEHGLRADVALVKARRADRYGNLLYTEDRAQLRSDHVHGRGRLHHGAGGGTGAGWRHRPRVRGHPGIFVDRVVVVADPAHESQLVKEGGPTREQPASTPARGWTRAEMAARVAVDIPDGSYVNLGIGMPELVAQFVPEGRELIYHVENGLLGMGPARSPTPSTPS